MPEEFDFQPLRRENVLLRLLLMGPTGSGKSRWALEIAMALFDGSLPVVGIDSEHGRMKLQADRFSRDVFGIELKDDFSPETYRRAMNVAAEKYPGGVLVIDGISQEWAGTNGVLQQADRFGDWKTIRPKHAAFVEEMLSLPMHLICTCRSKMKYEVGEEEVNGRTRQVIRKLGLGPIQDSEIAYEFDIVGHVDVDLHEVTFSNRCEPLVDQTMTLEQNVPGIITTWLSEGEPPVAPPSAPVELVEELRASLLSEGFVDAAGIEETFAIKRRQSGGVLPPEYIEKNLADSRDRIAKAAEKAERAAANQQDIAPDAEAERIADEAMTGPTA